MSSVQVTNASLGIIAMCLVVVGTEDKKPYASTMSADAIRAARAAINDAIARRDAPGIGAWLLADYHVVTARSAQRSGRNESVKSWAAMFELDPATRFERTPDDVVVSDEWGMAHERGRWEGGGMSGVYAAKWHRTEDGWRLQAEIFTPLSGKR